MPTLPTEKYTVAIVCALKEELAAVRFMFDEFHERPKHRIPGDINTYVLGRMSGHNIVLCGMLSGVPGLTSATRVATNMLRTFTSIRLGLMVGIGGGVPSRENDVRLGDVVVSYPSRQHSGIFCHDLGKVVEGEEDIQIMGYVPEPPDVLLRAVDALRQRNQGDWSRVNDHIEKMIQQYPRMRESGYGWMAERSDNLYNGATIVERPPRPNHNPVVHHGLIASGNQVIKDPKARNRLARKYNALCVEMEGAALMSCFPGIAIRGVCDYADSHKDDTWRRYAAGVAAGYAKEMLSLVKSEPDGTVSEVPAGFDSLFDYIHLMISEALQQYHEVNTGRI
ncbi:5'-methylthioadenosine/S-adenosylhomocysteine nucleosidase family protein [Aspergillus candidus]|uniref:Phosphorylase family protein n=1 Tax=Aspergillus candidus TaxID=41067 RepID=A0A2I2FLT9_ASPCN|nr:phosphorylase family protein [Aspergillus candidus]PLB41608.1 phosphorylase family protein [Aspergillus candidus]